MRYFLTIFLSAGVPGYTNALKIAQVYSGGSLHNHIQCFTLKIALNDTNDTNGCKSWVSM